MTWCLFPATGRKSDEEEPRYLRLYAGEAPKDSDISETERVHRYVRAEARERRVTIALGFRDWERTLAGKRSGLIRSIEAGQAPPCL
jgi:hypothetical protein